MRRAAPLLWIGFDGTTLPDRVRTLLRDGDIGGLSLFARNIRDARQTRDLVREIHAARPVPIAVDQEGGNVVRVGFGAVFPSAMALGATDDPALVERAAAAVARELRALGIGVDFAPVCDVNVEARNPIIGTRSFSDDPARCARLAAAWIRGMQAAGVACTAKHFPGHGATTLDSHTALPEVRDGADAIEERDLAPFKAAVEARVAQVMTAHVVYSALDSRPATYSSAILEGILRRRLGFDGVICSDALEMAGARLDGASPAATAIAAGVDIAHVCEPRPDEPEASLDAIERAGTAMMISPERFADAIRRSRAFAARWTCAPADELPPPDHALAREVAQRSITHVGPPLPSLREGAVVCAAFAPAQRSPVEELRDPLGALESSLRRRFGDRLTFLRDPREASLPRGATLVLATSSAFFDEAQRAHASRLARHRPALLLAMRSPYDAALFPELPALLTYGDVPVSLDAVAVCLAGERAPAGRLPIRLPARSL